MPAEKRTPESIFNTMIETLLNGQRRTVAHLDRLTTRVEELTAEMTKFSRNQIQMRSDMGDMRAEMNARLAKIDRRFEAIDRRFDAILARLEELDQAVDKHGREIHEMRIEVVGQYNDILNDLQSGHQPSWTLKRSMRGSTNWNAGPA